MDALQEFSDIALPNKQIDCPDNELVHPRYLSRNLRQYSRIAGCPVSDADQLIETFFRLNSRCRYAGFKSMPYRHRDFANFVNRGDMTFITLVRHDVASAVASLRVAQDRDIWIRAGEAQDHRWTFQREDKSILRTIARLWKELEMLRNVKNAIRLSYEGLCDAERVEVELNGYFGRTIKIREISPPTKGRSYVTNWDEFKEFVDGVWAELAARQQRRRGMAHE
ncbi:MAG: hypothetical protein QGH73_19125 [Rhodospirillales bacterium]|nr:hypothetical protein [Alphaproteobacteria bacterium]MDP6843789.1 hypothetical protein [Rhodospirillales bacterium]|tara:strand:- start:902 stop:1573 length:672 start_codon:yes stop_codon:yes gene_type:complete